MGIMSELLDQIDDNFIVELKALAKISKKEFTQLQQYMKTSGINNGCIININTDSVQVLAALPCERAERAL